MKLLKDFPLKRFNTFCVEAQAKNFLEVKKLQDLELLINSSGLKDLPRLILGEGSNILFVNDFDGLVLKISLKGKDIIREDDSSLLVQVSSGENWHSFVSWTVQEGYGGLENLSLIPGTIGAAPVQNIGAYGVELKDHFDSLEAYEISSGEVIKFSSQECKFQYRNSIFKQELKNQFIILSVAFRLHKKNPTLVTSYGDIEKELAHMRVVSPNSKDISQAVINLRKRKLPDPTEIGNAGSFFKNPIIEKPLYEALKSSYKEIPSFPSEADKVKIPAGWLIEKAGWKGKRAGRVGVHSMQALVLVNYGEASGREIYEFSKMISQDIQTKFHINLEPEVFIVI